MWDSELTSLVKLNPGDVTWLHSMLTDTSGYIKQWWGILHINGEDYIVDRWDLEEV